MSNTSGQNKFQRKNTNLEVELKNLKFFGFEGGAQKEHDSKLLQSCMND